YHRRFMVVNDEVQLLVNYPTENDTGALKPVIKTQNGASLGARVTGINTSDYHECTYDWWFKGKMDRAGMYNYALTADEIDDYFWNNVMTTNQVTYIRD
ncbi:MAG: hypothetical protein ACP5F3_02540, partial [Candidatus Syntrophosphaera sp.]